MSGIVTLIKAASALVGEIKGLHDIAWTLHDKLQFSIDRIGQRKNLSNTYSEAALIYKCIDDKHRGMHDLLDELEECIGIEDIQTLAESFLLDPVDIEDEAAWVARVGLEERIAVLQTFLSDLSSANYRFQRLVRERKRLKIMFGDFTHGLATRIQQSWRNCISNPNYAVCKSRLGKEFADIMQQ